MPNCRPSSKAADGERKKPPKKQALAGRTREGEEEEEEGEEDDEEEAQSLDTKKDMKAEPVGQLRKRRVKCVL